MALKYNHYNCSIQLHLFSLNGFIVLQIILHLPFSCFALQFLVLLFVKKRTQVCTLLTSLLVHLHWAFLASLLSQNTFTNFTVTGSISCKHCARLSHKTREGKLRKQKVFRHVLRCFRQPPMHPSIFPIISFYRYKFPASVLTQRKSGHSWLIFLLRVRLI